MENQENNINPENIEAQTNESIENQAEELKFKNWYIINVMAGQENKIAAEIKSMIASGALKENVRDVLIPSQEVIKVKRGKKVQESQKLFPGYVFINANINSDAYSALNAIPKVLGFLGSKNKPEEVSVEKMKNILLASEEKEVAKKDIIFEVGETLNVIDGPFESFSGVVEEFDHEKQKVKISISIFGRATSVELELNQVEKVQLLKKVAK